MKAWSLRTVVIGVCLLVPSVAPAQDLDALSYDGEVYDTVTDDGWEDWDFGFGDWLYDPDGDGRYEDELKDWEPSPEEIEYDRLIARLSQTRIDEWPILDLTDGIPQTGKGSTGVFGPIVEGGPFVLRGEVFTEKFGDTWTEAWILRDADALWSGDPMRLESVDLNHGTTIADGVAHYQSLGDPAYQRLTFTFQYAQFPPTDPTVINNLPPSRPAYISEAYAYRIFTKNVWTGVEVESGALYREQRYLGFSTYLGWNDIWVLWGDSFHRQSDGWVTRIEPTNLPTSMRSFVQGQVGRPGNIVITWARANPLQ